MNHVPLTVVICLYMLLLYLKTLYVFVFESITEVLISFHKVDEHPCKDAIIDKLWMINRVLCLKDDKTAKTRNWGLIYLYD